MAEVFHNRDESIITIPDMRKQEKTIQTFNETELPDMKAFFRKADHRITCLAIRPLWRKAADGAKAVVTTLELKKSGELVEEQVRTMESRKAILGGFKQAGRAGTIPYVVIRDPIALLGGLVSRLLEPSA